MRRFINFIKQFPMHISFKSKIKKKVEKLNRKKRLSLSRLPLVREIGEYASKRKSRWVVQELKKKICCMYEKVTCMNLYDPIQINKSFLPGH